MAGSPSNVMVFTPLSTGMTLGPVPSAATAEVTASAIRARDRKKLRRRMRDESTGTGTQCKESVRAVAYQRNTRGPISAPTTVGIAMPSKYHVDQNAGDISGQCRQYAMVAEAPASTPTAAPATRGRTGAMPRTAQSMAENVGVESSAMR